MQRELFSHCEQRELTLRFERIRIAESVHPVHVVHNMIWMRGVQARMSLGRYRHLIHN
jgi:hypothetical protein